MKKSERIEVALQKLENLDAYKEAPPDQQRKFREIVAKGAAGPVDNAMAMALYAFMAPALNSFYNTEVDMVNDAITAGLNTFKAAVIAEAFMQLWPNSNDAPDEALEMAAGVGPMYKSELSIFKNLTEEMMKRRAAKLGGKL